MLKTISRNDFKPVLEQFKPNFKLILDIWILKYFLLMLILNSEKIRLPGGKHFTPYAM